MVKDLRPPKWLLIKNGKHLVLANQTRIRRCDYCNNVTFNYDCEDHNLDGNCYSCLNHELGVKIIATHRMKTPLWRKMLKRA